MSQRKAIHFNDAMHIIASARRYHQTINIRVWTKEGEAIDYEGWYVHHEYWRGGYIRIKNPISNEIRTVPQIYIHRINDLNIYL